MCDKVCQMGGGQNSVKYFMDGPLGNMYKVQFQLFLQSRKGFQRTSDSEGPITHCTHRLPAQRPERGK